jgi:hypothetical protein
MFLQKISKYILVKVSKEYVRMMLRKVKGLLNDKNVGFYKTQKGWF